MPRKRPPSRLYKYQPWTPQTLANLQNRQLWFNAPKNFNDPFDCALPLWDPARMTDQDFLRFWEWMKEQRPPPAEIAVMMGADGRPNQRFRAFVLGAVKNAIDRRQKVQHEERGVVCLSANALDIRMWSHYADGHRGFCLEFDTTFVPFGTKTFEVRYSETFRYINPVTLLVDQPDSPDEENDLLVASVLTKSKCWTYEEEWRAIHIEANKPFGYDYHALTGIYLGARMPDAHKHILCQILHGSPTRLYDVQRDDKGFALHAVPATYTPPRYD